MGSQLSSHIPAHLLDPVGKLGDLANPDAGLVLGVVHRGTRSDAVGVIARQVAAEQAKRPPVRIDVPDAVRARGQTLDWESAVRGAAKQNLTIQEALPQLWKEVVRDATAAEARLGHFEDVRAFALKEAGQAPLRLAADELRLGSGLQHAVKAVCLHTCQAGLYVVEAVGVFALAAPIGGIREGMPLSLVTGSTWFQVAALWSGATTGLAVVNFLAVKAATKVGGGLAGVVASVQGAGVQVRRRQHRRLLRRYCRRRLHRHAAELGGAARPPDLGANGACSSGDVSGPAGRPLPGGEAAEPVGRAGGHLGRDARGQAPRIPGGPARRQ